jgi:hypothetical protein
VCVYYMLQAVQSKLKVFLRTRGRVGTPLTKTQGKESEKSNKRSVKVKLKSRWKRERKQRKEKGKE